MNRSRTDIVIRQADASDARALRWLAALDSAPAPLPGPGVFVAEVDGRIVAAFDQAADSAIADPFQPTAGLVDLLRLHARQQAAHAHARTRTPAARAVCKPLAQV